MTISINASSTTGVRNALGSNIRDNAKSATKLGTGDGIINAYEDPAGLAIGTSMRASYDVLSIVNRGIQQSQSMLYITEDGLKSAVDTVTKMQKLLTNAKLGYVDDTMIKNTLSPEYVQLKAEFGRIADGTKFNNQKLLDATSGTVSLGTAATLGDMTYDYSDATVSSMGTIAGLSTNTAITVATTNGGTAGTSVGVSGGTMTVTGGTITDDDTDTIVTGATITITGATITDNQSSSAVATVVIPGVTFKVGGMVGDDGSVTGAVTGLAIGDATAITFTLTDTSGGITAIASPTAITVTGTAADTTVSGVTASISTTGGVGAKSTFSFVSGNDISNDKIEVDFYNVRLADAKAGQKGLISTMNVTWTGLPGDLPTSAPTNLTDLTNEADANIDIPLVNALLDQLIIYRDNVGAYQSRFNNVVSQMAGALEQLDNAQGAIMNNDMAKENENFTRSSVKIKVAIAILSQMNEQLNNYASIVR